MMPVSEQNLAGQRAPIAQRNSAGPASNISMASSLSNFAAPKELGCLCGKQVATSLSPGRMFTNSVGRCSDVRRSYRCLQVIASGDDAGAVNSLTLVRFQGKKLVD